MQTFGVRDEATGRPMLTSLYMRIGSETKTFTVTALRPREPAGYLSDVGNRLALPERMVRVSRAKPGSTSNGQRETRMIQTGPRAKVIGLPSAVAKVVPDSAVGRDQRAL